MKILPALLVCGAMCAAGAAQQTRVEKPNPATPEQDAKGLSASVPEAYALSGKFERVVVLRFKHQTDLLAGIERMVKEQKIRNAVFLAGIGSVRNYHFHTVSNRTFPSKDWFVKDPTGPADIVSVNGYVIDGRVHAHITLTDASKAFGGHIEPGTNVFTFAALTLGVFADGLDLARIDDKTYR
jgi:predicted DNA-binding protein with PD1-like motif